MPRRLTNLEIDEVSGVDRGAGDGVRVVLMKRRGADDDDTVVVDLAALRKALGDVDTTDHRQAAAALVKTVSALMGDKTLKADARDKAVTKAVDDFRKHVAAGDDQENDDMTPEQIQKMIEDAVTKATSAANDKIAKLEQDAQVAALTAEELAVYKAFPTDDDKKKYLAKPKAERDKEAAEAKKRTDGVGADPVIKALRDETDDLKKRLAASDERDEIASFAKRATDIGLPAAHGEIMRKAYKGDTAAQTEHDKVLKGMAEQIRTGKVFSEFGGGSQQTGATAYDQLVAKGEEIRKTDSKLTKEQAFTKAYTDPANADLVAQSKQDEFRKRGIAA